MCSSQSSLSAQFLSHQHNTSTQTKSPLLTTSNWNVSVQVASVAHSNWTPPALTALFCLVTSTSQYRTFLVISPNSRLARTQPHSLMIAIIDERQLWNAAHKWHLLDHCTLRTFPVQTSNYMYDTLTHLERSKMTRGGHSVFEIK